MVYRDRLSSDISIFLEYVSKKDRAIVIESVLIDNAEPILLLALILKVYWWRWLHKMKKVKNDKMYFMRV